LATVSAIRLEPLTATHLDRVEAMLDDPDVQRFTRIPVPTPAGFAAEWIERYEQGWRQGSRRGFAIVDGDGEFLGVALVVRIEPEAQTVELGYIVSPHARGRGVATEAVRLLTDWALSELDAQRIELWISVANEPSKRVAERCGYVREGVLRSIWFKQDVRDDFEIWSRLPIDP
jgi:RimJ/RimL family protein N-acetyltransferase